MMLIAYRVLLLGLFFSSSLLAFPFDEERILSFISDITINTDSSMTVKESITVLSQGISIRRGIEREFPTYYTDRMGNSYSVAFDVTNVEHNGKPAVYQLSDRINGKVVRIGEHHAYLAPGEHTYTIMYETTRQLGFFEDYDELYWNVTGSGWRLPIDSVVARVRLPGNGSNVLRDYDGYTGYQGYRGKDYAARVDGDGSLLFSTTRKLAANEGFTLVATFAKGVVQEPSFWQKVGYFFFDNWGSILFACCLLLLLAWFLMEWRWAKQHEEKQTVIPLFYPPQGLSPGQIRYVVKCKYDPTVLTADIVDMAVQGVLKIKHHRGFFGAQQYTLTKLKEPEALAHKHQQDIARILFASSNEIMLTKKNKNILQFLIETIEYNFHFNFRGTYFKLNPRYVFLGIMSTVFFFASFLYQMVAFNALQMIVIAGSIGLVFALIAYSSLVYRYTSHGQSVLNEINGFKMFLSAAEEERIKLIGSPPDKNPELYEKYLPYAIALGVEERWAAQFHDVFAKLDSQGESYVPSWYFGQSFRGFNPTQFSRGITSSFKTAIISSGSVSGSFSGGGGRGYSGGGGGGGGGGGW